MSDFLDLLPGPLKLSNFALNLAALGWELLASAVFNLKQTERFATFTVSHGVQHSNDATFHFW